MISFNPHNEFYDCQFTTQKAEATVHTAGTAQDREVNNKIFNGDSYMVVMT